MKRNARFIQFPLAVAICLAASTTTGHAQKRTNHPGAELYTPTRIDWLTILLQASLRQDAVSEDGFILQIANPDSETILIYVRYFPKTDREMMNSAIDTARQVITITAKSYGWDSCLKVKEDVKMTNK